MESNFSRVNLLSNNLTLWSTLSGESALTWKAFLSNLFAVAWKPLLAVRVKPIGRADGIPVVPVTETAWLLVAKRSSLLSLLPPYVAKLPVWLKEPAVPLPKVLGEKPRPTDARRAGGMADEDVRWRPEPPRVKWRDDESFGSRPIISKGGREVSPCRVT